MVASLVALDELPDGVRLQGVLILIDISIVLARNMQYSGKFCLLGQYYLQPSQVFRYRCSLLCAAD